MPDFSRVVLVAVALLTVAETGKAQGVVRAYPFPATPSTALGLNATVPGAIGQERMVMVDPDKKLSAGDQVTVEIVEDREGGLPRMVTATGELDVPPLGRVRVSGMTASEAASEIKQLLERDYYYRATVRLGIDRVSPASVRRGRVYLSGEVHLGGPQEMMAGETLTLSNAILMSGLTEWADPKRIQITRQKKGGGLEKLTVNFKRITQAGDATQDPVLEDGDRIFVPKIFWRGP
jgi:polysaccharide export outer membrane protein